MQQKLFGTDGIRGIAGKFPLDNSTVSTIGTAIGYWIKQKKKQSNQTNTKINKNPYIVIGRDTRTSGKQIEQKLANELINQGCGVMSIGILPTPGIAFLTKEQKADLGIIISASHNPAEYNGIKIFNENGIKLDEKEEEEIEQAIQMRLKNTKNMQIKEMTDKTKDKEYQTNHCLKQKYSEHIKQTINTHLAGLKIAIDSANGAAHIIGPQILRELGAEAISINDQGNGNLINDKSGALHPESIRANVLETKADMGVALDGDADRVILVDEQGTILDGDEILAICAIQLKEEEKLRRNTIATTVMSNIGLDNALLEKGIRVVRTQVGDKYVVEEMLKWNYALGGEQSGHIIFMEHSTTGDGLITALQVMKIMKTKNKKLSELRQTMKKAPQTLINIPVNTKKEFELMPKTTKTIKQAEQELGNKGRILVRYSGTENKARVLVEGKDARQVQKLAETIANAIKEETR